MCKQLFFIVTENSTVQCLPLLSNINVPARANRQGTVWDRQRVYRPLSLLPLCVSIYLSLLSALFVCLLSTAAGKVHVKKRKNNHFKSFLCDCFYISSAEWCIFPFLLPLWIEQFPLCHSYFHFLYIYLFWNSWLHLPRIFTFFTWSIFLSQLLFYKIWIFFFPP